MCATRSCITGTWWKGLKAKGARFVENLSEIPPDAVTIFSAHGVARNGGRRGGGARPARARRDLSAGDQGSQPGQALCRAGPDPDPGRSRRASRSRRNDGPDPGAGPSRPDREGRRHRWSIPNDAPVAYVTQTTLSVDDTRGIIAALQRRFSDIVGPETRDICYATQNRQTAVRELSKLVDVILVVGANQQLQFQPSARNRIRIRGSELSDCGRQRAQQRLGQGCARGRHYGGRIGAGRSGRGCH